MSRTVYFCNIHSGSPEQNRDQFLYVRVNDASTHEMLLSSTMEYAIKKIYTNKWVVVPQPQTDIKKFEDAICEMAKAYGLGSTGSRAIITAYEHARITTGRAEKA